MQLKPTVKIRTTSFQFLKKSTSAICVSSIMTPRAEFEYCMPYDLLDEKLKRMQKRKLDAIPMARGIYLKTDEFREYLTQENIKSKRKRGFKYCKDAAVEIESEDLIREDLPIEHTITKFSSRKNKTKIPFFITNANDQIIGLMTLADLDKVAVKMYLFALISELELSLLEIVSKHFKKLRDVCQCRYCVKKRKMREKNGNSQNKLDEYYYLYLKELIHMVRKSECVSENHKKIKEIFLRKGYNRVLDLRNTVAHPKPLVSGKFPIYKLTETVDLIENLISTCKRHQNA